MPGSYQFVPIALVEKAVWPQASAVSGDAAMNAALPIKLTTSWTLWARINKMYSPLRLASPRIR